MRIGLIDVDAESRGKVTFPNLSLMKLSAYYKSHGHHVEWYKPLLSGHMDVVFMSKVFGDEYTKDYQFPVDADQVIKGGSGYAISVVDGIERYNMLADGPLPECIDHIMPDYRLYGIADTAYGFLTKGCPRGCKFCHVDKMQGRKVYHFAHLSEFWNGQKNIVLLDPNLLAHRDWRMYMDELAVSGAWVDFSQGLDLRLLTEDAIEALNRVKWKNIHFAWDNPKDDLRERLKNATDGLDRANRRTVTVYVLTNFNSTHEEDLARIMAIREAGAQPYVMIYRKPTAPKVTRRLARWVNAPNIFWSVPTFSEYQCKLRKERVRERILRGQSNRDKIVSWNRGRRTTASPFSCHEWCASEAVEPHSLTGQVYAARDLSSGWRGLEEGHRKGGGHLNLHATARKLQTALTLKGRDIKINQFQSYSEHAERMVTKFVLSEKRKVEDKEKDVAICSTYSMADVVKTLAAILNDGGDG